MGGFIYWSKSAFLSERTIGVQTRKVLILAITGKWEEWPYYNRQYGEQYCLLKRETMRYRLADLDLGFCLRIEVHDKTMERENLNTIINNIKKYNIGKILIFLLESLA